MGFGKTEIKAYIQEACEQSHHLLDCFELYLSDNPFVYSVMCNPLHCSIITELYILHWRRGKKSFAPKTLTEIYTYLVSSLLDRACDSDFTYCLPSTIPIFPHLPGEVCEQLLALGRLAADGIKEQQYIFDNITCETMGLLRKVEGLYTEAHRHTASCI